MFETADAITDFGDARLWSESIRVDLRVAEMANPRSGDRIEIDGDAFLIQVSRSVTASGSSGPSI